MAKKKAKQDETMTDRWEVTWCRKNVEELRKYGHGWATVHPEHGIVAYDGFALIKLIGRGRFLKRSVVKECVYVSIVDVLRFIDFGAPVKKFKKALERSAKKTSKQMQRWVKEINTKNPPHAPELVLGCTEVVTNPGVGSITLDGDAYAEWLEKHHDETN